MSFIKELINETNLTSVLVFIFLVFISSFYLYISFHNEIVGLTADDAVYLLMVDYFSPYYSSLSKSAAFIMNTSQFPPLYPLLMSLIGASSEKLVIAHLVTTSCLILGVIIYFLWVYEEQRNVNAGLCLALIFLCSPATLLMNIDLWSEHLYILLTMCALLFIEKANKNDNYWMIVALFIGLLPVTRLVGVAFVAAFFLYLHLHNIKYRYKYIAISLAPLFIWKLVSIIFYSSGIYESILTTFYQYGFWLHIKHLFFVQLPDLWTGWHECFDIQKKYFSGIVSSCILILSLVTWLSRLKNKRIDSLYILFYLLIIWVWPNTYHHMRFMFVVFPILLYYSYLSILQILKYDVMQNLKLIISYASVFIILATFLPTDLYAINRFSSNIPSDIKPFRNTKYWITEKNRVEAESSIRILNKMILSYRQASPYVPEGKCVYTPHQEQFMYYARKLAYPLPTIKEVKDNSIFPYLDKCEYIHVLHTTSHPEYSGGYPLDRLDSKFNYLMFTRMSEDKDSPIVGELIQLH